MEMLIVIIVSMLILLAFFSGMETSFLCSNKLRFEIERKQSPVYSRIASFFFKSPGLYLSTILVGNNIALVVYALSMSALYSKIAGDSNYLLITIIAGFIVVFLGVFLPKAVVKSNPNFYLRTFYVLIYIFYVVFYPLSKFATAVSTLLLRITGQKVTEPTQVTGFGKDDLATLMEEVAVNEDNKGGTNDDNEHHIRLFQNALGFSQQRVRECMVPRTDVEGIEVSQSVDELWQLFVNSGYSRLAVFEGTIDNIIGYANLKSLFNKPNTIQDILQETIYVPETMSQQKLLGVFIKSHKALAVVIDEFGSTAGLITIEDLLEQIFGEIEDEHDADYLIEKEIAPGEYILAGRLEIDHLNVVYKLSIPDSERYDTLAGYILTQSEDIPKSGEIIRADGLKIKILRTSHTRIELVQITKALKS